MHNEPPQEESLFEEALKCPSAKARAAFLDDACRGRPELRARLDVLLEGHFMAQGFLGDASDARQPTAEEQAGATIGRYKLLEKIGEGGFGVVYQAEQREPVKRRVALKIIKPGMDTKQVVARFEAERQALALMDHPGIARVFDGGATEAGRPYFVMELVSGVPITTYCDEQQLSAGERLRLFVQVCDAVQHAHQKGIIHRDLKPSNILVTVINGRAVPKVIDFGVAKAMQQELTEKTIFTQFQHFIGTPAYVSPEQAQLTSQDIDTRSDIYALGVLLYELLTDKTPFDGKQLLAVGLDEMRRIIREVEPVKPSTRLTQELNSRSEIRGPKSETKSAIRNLNSAIPSDLDWIVMKCLEKDRTRRYATANGLATDIARHLHHEPIIARPPSRLYRLQKSVQRNKLTFGAALLVSVAAALAVVVLAVSNFRISAARRAEIAERQKSDAANRELRHTVSVLELQRAEDFFRTGDAGLGVAHLATMLRRDPSNYIAASRLTSALIHRDWALRASPPMVHTTDVESVRFSPDGRHLLTVSQDKAARIWDATTGELVASLQHRDQVFRARYNSNGTRIVTASADGTARIWNSYGAPLLSLDHQKRKVRWVEFSPDGKSIVTACAADNSARIWDAETGALTHEFSGHGSEVLVATFSPDNQQVATGTRAGLVVLWEMDPNKAGARLGTNRAQINTLAFSPDGHRLAAGDDKGLARLWSVRTRQSVGPRIDHLQRIYHVAFTPDSALLPTVSQDGVASLWDSPTGHRTGAPVTHHEGGVVYGEFSPDGRTIVTASMDCSARLWDTYSGSTSRQPLRAWEAVRQASFSPDGQRLVTGADDGVVQVWDLRRRRYAGVEAHFRKRVRSVVFGPAGKTLLAGSEDGTARVMDPTNGRALAEPMQHEVELSFADFSPDGERVVTACTNGEAHVWDWRAGQRIASTHLHSDRILTAQFSPDGKRVVTASADGTARVWLAGNGQAITPPLTQADQVQCAQFSPDGRLIATGSSDGTARIWDAQTGQPAAPPLKHRDTVHVEFSPDGKRLLTASRDNTAGIWDVQTGRLLVPPLQHTRLVTRASFSPDGQRAVTASWDNTARVWDANTGLALTPPLKDKHAMLRACFSADAKRILTACVEGHLRLWDSNTGQPLTESMATGGGISWGDACFDSSGERIVAGGDLVRIWEVPPVPTPVPDWFPPFAEAIAGVRLSPRGSLEIVSGAEYERIVQELKRREGDQFYERVCRWFLADPDQRPPAPPTGDRDHSLPQPSHAQ